MAFDAEASSTSLSVMAPTPERKTLSRTLSFESLASKSVSTSTEPPTSPLRMMLSSFMPAVLICSARPSSDTRELLASVASRAFCFAVFGDAAGLVAIGNDDKLIARLRQAFHAENFDRRRWRSYFYRHSRDRRTWRGPCRKRCPRQSCRPLCSVPF